MTPRKRSADVIGNPLFPNFKIPDLPKQKLYGRIEHPIWSEHKAHFIQQYLKTFIQITHHGIYIDGFAGPQNPKDPESWTAKLVLEMEPKWLKRFFLCELSRKSVKALKKLAASEPKIHIDRKGHKYPRVVEVVPGDFNTTVDGILNSKKISDAEATFCLLDQRTFECHWDTVRKLAFYKKPPRTKIEVLYFLGIGWLHRSLYGTTKNRSRLEKWWGAPDFDKLKDMTEFQIAELVRQRFMVELGYKHVGAYAIFENPQSNNIMYYMIHASDHDEAPALMRRAHAKAVRSLPKEKQLLLEGLN